MVIRGQYRRQTADMEMRRAVNHELANLISYAVHKPAAMPKYRAVQERGKIREATEADHDVLRTYFKKLAAGPRGASASS